MIIMNEELIEHCARIAHELNRGWSAAHGDNSHKSWKETSEHIKGSTRNGARLALEKPEMTPRALHEEWSKYKLKQGYAYGPEKSEADKTHPCLVPYDSLPPIDRAKDELFAHAVRLAQMSFEPYIEYSVVE